MSGELASILRLEVDIAAPRNLIRNTSGQMGFWGYQPDAGVSIVTGSASAVAEDGFAFQFTGASSFMISGPISVQGGTYVHAWASYIATGAFATPKAGIFLYFYDSQGLLLSPTTVGAYSSVSTVTTVIGTRLLAPAGAVTARLVVTAQTATGSQVTVGKIAVRSGMASGDPLGAYAPPNWINLMGKTGTIDTEQGNSLNGVEDEIEPGSLVAKLQDSTIDPATSATLRKGRPVRVIALVGGVRKAVWTGRLETADVDYDDSKNGTGKATIDLVAIDDGKPLNEVGYAVMRDGTFETQIAHAAQAANLNVTNGTNSAFPTTSNVQMSRDDSAKASDWIRRICNTYGGYAWIDAENKLQCKLITYLSSTPVVTFSDRNADVGSLKYTSIGLNYGSRALTNTLTVRRINLDEIEDDGSKDYGPYVASASVAENEAVPGSIEILTGSPAAVANVVLPLFATPKIYPTSLRVNAASDLATVLGITPYTPIRVKRASPAYNEVVRVLRIKHSIRAVVGKPDVWTTSFDTRPLEVGTTTTVTTPMAGADTGPSDVATLNPGLLCRVARIASFSVANASNTTVPYDTVVSSNGISWDSANNRFVVPKDGRYTMTALATFIANGTGGRIVLVYVNGTQVMAGRWTPSASVASSFQLVETLPLLTGDVVSVVVQHSAGAALGLDPNQLTNRATLSYIGP